MKRLAAAVAATVALAVPGVADAHYWAGQGTNPPHTHSPCYTTTACWRWILANGAVRQGDVSNLIGETPLVLVACSYKAPSLPGWQKNTQPIGPYGNTGDHPYCKSPVYTFSNGTQLPWSLTSP